MPRPKDNPPKMPEDYKGKDLNRQYYHLTTPREWTTREIEWAWDLREKGYSSRQIGESIGRSTDSVKIKMKRVKKEKGIYNDKSQAPKYHRNGLFYETIKPKTVADVYCGRENYWKTYHPEAIVTSNDKDPAVPADHNRDALEFLCLEYAAGNKYDVIDLDPYGSAFECLDLATRMAKKGLIVTLGEMGHVRFKRLDFVKYRYGIESMEDFTQERLVEEIQKIGRRNKKQLTVAQILDWKNEARVWFKVEPYTSSEPWKKREGEDK